MTASKTAARLFGLALGFMTAAGVQQSKAVSPASVAYSWRNVAIGGGGFVTGIAFHPRQQDLLYARTDVGGAYRWDGSVQRWVPITDWIGPEEVNLAGIESLALDPSDPNRVYLAAGTYSHNRAAILRSSDRGKTFNRTDVPFEMGGNETGRSNGERLAVDPNLGEILFFGSRHDGLWRSSDRGSTWQKVEGFPNVGSGQPSRSVPDAGTNARPRSGFAQQQVGIVCVLFDSSSGQAGHPTPDIYAAVSTTETNLFRSTNAGAVWEIVPSQPVGLRPNHLVLSPDRVFYLSYGKEPGPNSMTDGAVWKYKPTDGVWTDITPAKPAATDQPFGYGAVTVDARHPSTIMVTTFDHWKPHDEIYRSTNGGLSWMQLWQNATGWDHSNAPYTTSRTPHWMGDIKIDPFNSDWVLFTTGYGIWSCVNATEADSGRPTRWVFLDNGLEETVPLTLISPPDGAHLLSGVGDIDGFRHDDLDVSPAEGTFAGPRYSNTENLAFAGGNAKVIVRTGTGRNSVVRAAISMDGGKTWNALASEPPNSGGGGIVTVSADGKTIVWTPRRSAPHYSTNLGANWTACAGLSSLVPVVADAVDPERFYAYDARAGKLFVSTNGAIGFLATAASFPLLSRTSGSGGGGAILYATPGHESDLWLAYGVGGLFRSSDGGVSFTKVESVQQANSLGFGKAAPGQKYPALYLIGRINDFAALFRSDNGGITWVRINDDRHQFGWINHVMGDPRVYGRVYFATGGRGVIYGDPDKTTRP
jgi:hypothetical protein